MVICASCVTLKTSGSEARPLGLQSSFAAYHLSDPGMQPLGSRPWGFHELTCETFLDEDNRAQECAAATAAWPGGDSVVSPGRAEHTAPSRQVQKRMLIEPRGGYRSFSPRQTPNASPASGVTPCRSRPLRLSPETQMGHQSHFIPSQVLIRSF